MLARVRVALRSRSPENYRGQNFMQRTPPLRRWKSFRLRGIESALCRRIGGRVSPTRSPQVRAAKCGVRGTHWSRSDRTIDSPGERGPETRRLAGDGDQRHNRGRRSGIASRLGECSDHERPSRHSPSGSSSEALKSKAPPSRKTREKDGAPIFSLIQAFSAGAPFLSLRFLERQGGDFDAARRTT